MTTIDRVFDPKATTIPVIRYLVALADHGHFGRAALACGISQPTLSAQVSKWERRMGIAVFERADSGVRPTPIGERVIAEARRLLAGLQVLEEAAAMGQAPFFGAVRIGIIPTLGPYLLPLIGPVIEAQWPDLEWPVTEGITAHLLEALDAHRLDLLMVALVADIQSSHETLSLFDEPFHVALSTDHVLARQEAITPGDLAGERVLLLDDGHCLRDQALEVCGARPKRLGGDYRATSLETLRQLVALGHGITLLPALAVHAGPPDRRVVTVPLKGARARRTIGLMWRASDRRVDAYRLMAPVIRTAVAKQRRC